MAEQLAELCALLVDDFYGELPTQVFKTLAHWGRITLQTLILHSGLPRLHVQYGITMLIQQHLVLHFTPEGDDTTWYEVDWSNAYNLMRSGKVINVVKERYGEGAGQLVENLLQLGHARVGDLTDAYKFDSQPNGTINSAAEHVNGEGMPNGIVNNRVSTKKQMKKIATPGQLHTVLYRLLEDGFVTRVRRRNYHSTADINAEAEEVVKREQFPDGKVSGPKAREAFGNAVSSLKRKWREESDNGAQAGVSRGVINRKNGYGPAPKRAKINGFTNGIGRYDDDEEDGVRLENDMVVKVNYAKCTVALRSEQLERLAARLIGDTTSRVYAALLVLLEKNIPRCYDDLATYLDEDNEEAAQPETTTVDISEILDPSLDLVSTIGVSDDMTDGYGDEERTSIKQENSEANTYRDRNKRLKQIEQHLILLAEHPRRFVTKVGNLGQGQWRVNFPALTRNLQRTEIETVINARFGTIATRIVRMLASKGKLDEKQLANFALMRQKDIRAILTGMQEAGFVESQEVPKDNSRQPSRTLFLWNFDHDRCRQLVITDAYKGMARLLQRIQVQKAKYQGVLDKAERLDVVGHEDEYLTQEDKGHLRTWRDQEERLLTQLARQDEAIALLRDFSGP